MGIARAVSLALILSLVPVVTFPWRLLFDTGHPRVLYQEQRAYQIGTSGPDILLYVPDLRSTIAVPSEGSGDLLDMGTNGYLFESPESFRRGEESC